jgi:hypothetical protein
MLHAHEHGYTNQQVSDVITVHNICYVTSQIVRGFYDYSYAFCLCPKIVFPMIRTNKK